MSDRKPMLLRYAEGQVCEAGQHENCTPVGDPFEDGTLGGGRTKAVWVCSCDCHKEAP